MQNNKAPETGLTHQQDQFCYEYIKDFNATKAAERAKYSKRAAHVTGHRLLKNAKIRERIEFYKQESLYNADITTEQIIHEWKGIAFADFTRILKERNNIVSLDELKKLPGPVRRAIKSFKLTKKGIEIKLWSKEKALEKLGQYQGLEKLYLEGDINLKSDNEVIFKVVQVNGAGPPKKDK